MNINKEGNKTYDTIVTEITTFSHTDCSQLNFRCHTVLCRGPCQLHVDARLHNGLEISLIGNLPFKKTI